MFTKIIVGIDGTPGGEDALALARALADEDAQLVLVAVYPHDEHPSRGTVQGFEDLMRTDAIELLDAVAAGSGLERRAVPDSSPARALQHVAEETGAELIVVGSSRRGALGRLLVGDVSRAVLHGAHCPVLVAPRGSQDRPAALRTIGVGFTDAPESRAALDVAAELARRTGAELRLCTSVSLPAAFAPGYAYAYDWDSVNAEHRRYAEAQIAEVAAGLDVPVNVQIGDRGAGADLVALSESVDLLVVGSRGWGTGRRVVLGSTSDHLVHHAHCPVLVVPAPARDREGSLA